MSLVEPFKHLLRSANAAGYSTTNPQVQAALLQTFANTLIVNAICSLVDSTDRCGDYLRDLTRKREGW